MIDNLKIFFMQMTWKWRVSKEIFAMWVAFHLPRFLAYWCAIRVMTYNNQDHPDSRTCSQVLQDWDKPREKKYIRFEQPHEQGVA